jgi:hypothetical protein
MNCIFCDSVLDDTGYHNSKCKRCSHRYLDIYFTFCDSNLEMIHFYGKKYSALLLYGVKETVIADHKTNESLIIKRILNIKPSNFNKQIELILLMQ